jgi:hypothetical protein
METTNLDVNDCIEKYGYYPINYVSHNIEYRGFLIKAKNRYNDYHFTFIGLNGSLKIGVCFAKLSDHGSLKHNA